MYFLLRMFVATSECVKSVISFIQTVMFLKDFLVDANCVCFYIYV